MTATATLFLVRHGETVWHGENRYAGSSDVALTEVGRAQAARLAHWAARAELTAIATSDLTRARDTAAPAAAVTGLVPVVDADLREQHFGAGEGRTLRELGEDPAAGADRFADDPWANPFPDAEDPAHAADRFLAALARVARTAADTADAAGATTTTDRGARRARVLVVCHNTVLRLAVCRLTGIPGRDYRRVLGAPDNTAYAELLASADGDGPVTGTLVRWNVPIT